MSQPVTHRLQGCYYLAKLCNCTNIGSKFYFQGPPSTVSVLISPMRHLKTHPSIATLLIILKSNFDLRKMTFFTVNAFTRFFELHFYTSGSEEQVSLEETSLKLNKKHIDDANATLPVRVIDFNALMK